MVIGNKCNLAYMTTLSERVTAALEAAGMDQSDLARRVGVTSVAVNNWCTGETKSIKGKNLLRAAAALKVNPEWLSDGLGPMKPSDFGSPIVTPLRPVRVIESDDDLKEEEIIEVPRYTVKASAGHGAPVLEIDTKGQPNYCRAAWAKSNGYKPENLFSIVAEGDSMEPHVPDGSSMIVHRQSEIVNGKVHVICRDNECFVKRLFRQMDGSVLVRSDNQALYRDIVIQPDDPNPLRVVGVVASVAYQP